MERYMQTIIQRLPEDLRQILRAQPLFVAGGFIRNLIVGDPATDIDIFGATKVCVEDAAQKLYDIRGGDEACIKVVTANAITIVDRNHHKLTVQFITRWC